jgi:hypothetical protein
MHYISSHYLRNWFIYITLHDGYCDDGSTQANNIAGWVSAYGSLQDKFDIILETTGEESWAAG